MSTDPRIDAYIARAETFARPILKHLRELVHKGCPDVTEDMKWSRPAFLYKGKITYSMAAFNRHCGFGFWHPGMSAVLEREGRHGEDGSGSLGRITSLSDLPPDKEFLRYIREAKQMQEDAPAKVMPRERKPPAPATVPDELAAKLKKDKAATAGFHALSPSHQREYIEWIVNAKRPETRSNRIDTLLELVREGKSLNWKYEKPSKGRT